MSNIPRQCIIFSNQFSCPGRAVGQVCLSVIVSFQQRFEWNAFDLDIWHTGISNSLDQVCRSTSLCTGYAPYCITGQHSMLLPIQHSLLWISLWMMRQNCNYYVRQHICYSAYMLWQFRPSVCPSFCPSHGWISQKRLKLGSRSFHNTVAPSL